MTLSAEIGWLAAMLIDASFLALVAAAAAREILAGRNWRNLKVRGAGRAAAGRQCRLPCRGAFRRASPTLGIRIGIAVVVLLISLIGGRIIPSFTRNWLVRENPGRLPAPFGRFDMMRRGNHRADAGGLDRRLRQPAHRRRAGVGGRCCIWCAWRAGPATAPVASGWCSILHVGYAFVPLGFSAQRRAPRSGWFRPSAGVHAWMAGAAGIMTLAVMSRATLGHTGQPLTASRADQAIYAAIIVAALARVCAVIEPAHGEQLLHLAAFAWAAAFFGFAISYGPLLAGADRRRKVVA